MEREGGKGVNESSLNMYNDVVSKTIRCTFSQNLSNSCRKVFCIKLLVMATKWKNME